MKLSEMFWSSPARPSSQVRRPKIRRTKTRRSKADVILETLVYEGREILIRRVPYARRISITVNLRGQIRVSTPLATPDSYIQNYLKEHESWMQKALSTYESLRKDLPQRRYAHGELFPYLGNETPLHYVPGKKSEFHAAIGPGEIIFYVPPAMIAAGFDIHAPHPELAPLMRELYKGAGKKFLRERLEHYCSRTGLRPATVAIRSQKTRWGSCSWKRKISLNWRLMFASKEVIDYVVVHELMHLEFFNHSPEFWEAVGKIIPDYRKSEQFLKKHFYDADFLAKRSDIHV